MTVITLTGDLGSMGSVGTLVATQLGYSLADRELLIEAAQALGWSEVAVAAFEERTAGQGTRLTRFMQEFAGAAAFSDLDIYGLGMLVGSTYGATAAEPNMRPPDQRYIAVLSALIRALAERGNAVIVGRGGLALLAGEGNTLHVRVVCDRDERVRRICSRDDMTPADATARVADSDQQRRAWHQKYFRIDYASPSHYHAVLNSGRLADAEIADVVVQLARDVERRHGVVAGPGPNVGES